MPIKSLQTDKAPAAIGPYSQAVRVGTLVFLSGLQTIPRELYKAARVDGAGASRRFLHVTLPELRYPLAIVLIVISLEGLMAFSLIYMMTGGGPGTATTVLACSTEGWYSKIFTPRRSR